ncbi:nitrite reductase large subunit NirB [Paenibacillus oenotherae]|uniref:Nitrite reductase large subunit NirB n=1 Tax=Paenibacillus oenotherae TaxID=1435645 RepID=A0ABS7D8U5_9BACL|nr:nitrite reductase large subunit NirB [Paenibacillus oenotherae]MBW7476358.1 nitrite reductase large subunit NirB [Paenibacillus oenotherae]
MTTTKEKLVLVGNGMAGINTIEQILKLAPSRYDITVFGGEPYPNYNRIMLSYVLEGSKTLDDIILNGWSWYQENNITLHTGTNVTRIDTAAKVVMTDSGSTVPYDVLIIATGSNPIMLPIPGKDKEGVIGFRDIADCSIMLAASRQYKKAAVIGGGLLGLEAAKGLVNLGMEATVVHLMPELMERQLDPVASAMLKAELERQGLKFLMEKGTSELIGGERVEGLRFTDGTELEADLVVMAVGIRPNTAVVEGSGIEVNRGIVVDDYMRTSAPGVYAVGECNEHRGVCYGLVAPLFEQGQILAKHITGTATLPYEGSIMSTKLKISGVDVFSAGKFMDSPELTVIRKQDEWKNIYKKLMLQDGKIVGGVLFGDVMDSAAIQQWIRTGATMTEELYAEFMGTAAAGSQSPAERIAAMPNEEIVCGCNGVSKGAIISAIQDQGLTTIDEIKACTGAGRSCGGCIPTVGGILEYVLGDKYANTAVKTGICGCTTMSRDEIVAAIREKRLTTIREVMHVLEWKNTEGCSKCRPAINYYLGMAWPQEHEDEKDSRFVNERLNANIQKDGTYTVIPRMYGGVTTPEELRRIAEVAVKFDVKMVKVTGGQRLDLVGVKKEDLPDVWSALDMPSGYGYAKALRTVKTCVGSLYCRFGTQDSVNMGIQLERMFERLDMPAKLKMAVNGCPRNCAESCTKDIGFVGNDGGWEIYVGGNGGIKPRIADLLCKVKTDEELKEVTGAFLQYYRENAKYLERTSDWVERVGLQQIVTAVVEDEKSRRELNERITIALAQVKEPWSEVIADKEIREHVYGNLT